MSDKYRSNCEQALRLAQWGAKRPLSFLYGSLGFFDFRTTPATVYDSRVEVLMKRIASLLFIPFMFAFLFTSLAAAQAPTPEDTQRFTAIKARHDKGEPVTAEEQQFAMRYMQRQSGQAGGQGRQPTPEERRRFQDIMERRKKGEDISPEDRDFAMRMRERMGQGQGQQSPQQQAARFAEYAKTHPPRESTGLAPLPDLGKGEYQGEQGGLYPGGENKPPAAHLKAGLALARAIAPLDTEGRKSENGKIVLLSIGMSNTTMEFSAFQKLAEKEKDLSPRLAIVDGAQGGQTAAVTANNQANYWNVVDERLTKAGVTRQQVQAVWLKQANAQPARPFPAEAKKLQADVVETLHNLAARFPNLKIAYLSNRIYAGYAASALNPEPHSYEGGFAVKWVIADQIAGKPELNYDPAKGAVRSPWVAWGPYLWTDGLKGRKDGLTWNKDEVGPDGTHPSQAGREKVAKLLLDFLKSDPTARPWFLAGP
jgi:hypothetical protein